MLNKSCFLYCKAFLSNRYGTRMLKSSINKKDFNLIKSEIEKADRKKANEFAFCYIFDKNSNEYKLKSIKEITDGLKVNMN